MSASVPAERLRVPFLNASPSIDMLVLAALWPLWWLIGIDQFIVVAVILWAALREFAAGRLSTPRGPALWAIAVFVWWAIAIVNVTGVYTSIFLKEMATVAAQAALLLLVARMGTVDERRLLRALDFLVIYVALGTAIFVTGLWRGEIRSLIGLLMSSATIDSSAFFASIGVRSFGMDNSVGEILEQRVASFALQYSGLSFLTLLAMPYALWRARSSTGPMRLVMSSVIVMLVLALIYAQSRSAWAVFVVAIILGVLLAGGFGRRYPILHVMIAGMATVLVLALLYAFALGPIVDFASEKFLKIRPGSALVRFRMYEETIRLFPEHPLVGWGTSIRVEGLPNRFSAGTHSAPLGALFQHGIVGLTLATGLWVSILRRLSVGLRFALPRSEREFYIAMMVGFTAFSLRALADLWTWDQLLCLTVWIAWALILLRSQNRLNGSLSNHDLETP